MSRRDILDRYEILPDGRAVIEVSAASVSELYNNFDRNAPFVRKDLDEELASYLKDSVHELGKQDFIVRFVLQQLPDAAQRSRVETSMATYFTYLAELERRDIWKALRRGGVLLLAGVMTIGLEFSVASTMQRLDPLAAKILLEGLTILSWVAVWECTVTLLGRIPGAWRNRRRLQRLAKAERQFTSLPVGGPDDVSRLRAP
ncbi:MAG: hypothetical protein RL095_3019 [Verrucomicrobiota bacterium]|jgi:hypothetical protein